MKPSIQAHQFVLADGPSPSAPLPEGEAPPPYNTLPPGAAAATANLYPQLQSETPAALPQPQPPFNTEGWSEGTGFSIHGNSSQSLAVGGASVQTNFSPQHGGACGGSMDRDTKLSYMDFVPRMIKKRIFQKNEYETFEVLIERANDWLEEHSWITVISCETLTWSGLKASNIYSDASCFERSISATRKTKNIVGLRLWFTQDTFPCRDGVEKSPTVIECRTFIPQEDTETFTQMIHRTNDLLLEHPLIGSIFSVEVIPVACRHSSPNTCFWREDPELNKVYSLCLRVYAKLVAGVRTGVETLGYKSFVPQVNGQSKENRGFEVFSSVVERASRWISSQDGVRFVSVKSLNVKLKKKGEFEERCVFTEHLCARHRENILTGISSTTRYLRTLRAFYVLHVPAPSASPTADACLSPSNPHSNTPSPQVRLTCRTFAPSQIGVVTSSVPVNMCNQSPYEETRKVLERINQWLAITGAKLFHIETISSRQTALPQVMSLGSDATFSQNSLHSCRSNIEHWIHYIRLYIDGEYREPPGAVSLVVPSVRPL